jgi:hypothetical protein
MLHPRIKSLKKLFQVLMVICGCLHLTGGPHALVQSYAWISMIIQYSKDDGLAKGVKDTFSGERPCPLCKKIDAVKKDEAKQPLSKEVDLSALAKFRTECHAQEIIRLKPPRHVEHKQPPILGSTAWMSSWHESPVSPPPELA